MPLVCSLSVRDSKREEISQWQLFFPFILVLCNTNYRDNIIFSDWICILSIIFISLQVQCLGLDLEVLNINPECPTLRFQVNLIISLNFLFALIRRQS